MKNIVIIFLITTIIGCNHNTSEEKPSIIDSVSTIKEQKIEEDFWWGIGVVDSVFQRGGIYKKINGKETEIFIVNYKIFMNDDGNSSHYYISISKENLFFDSTIKVNDRVKVMIHNTNPYLKKSNEISYEEALDIGC